MLPALQTALAIVTIVLLARIGYLDFRTQKIANRDVLALGLLGVANLALTAAVTGNWWSVLLALLGALMLFIVLLPFWVFRKVGAGDVKLIAAAPLVADTEHIFLFTIILLFFTFLMVIFLKYYALFHPYFLRFDFFRENLSNLAEKRIVPFGVPISLSLIGVVLIRMF